jgi:hypothetical protein
MPVRRNLICMAVQLQTGKFGATAKWPETAQAQWNGRIALTADVNAYV